MDWPARLENHWLTCMAAVGGGGRTTRLPGALAVTNPHVPGSTFNFVALRASHPDLLETTLDMGATLLAAEGRPPAVYLAPPAGDVGTLARRLAELGWKQQVRQVVLARPLPLPETQVSPQVHVTDAHPDQLALWAGTLVEGYEVHPVAGEALAAAWLSLQAAPADEGRAHLCLARVEGRAAGTGLTWVRGDLAGLYCGAVVPVMRRHGVERATLVYRLAEAAAAGCTAAFLQTEAGSPVEHLCLHRLGFEAVYERSLWIPAATQHCG